MVNNILKIKVVQCKDLMAADANGKSDPYVELRIVSMKPADTTTKKTKVIKKDLNPVFNEEFQFSILNPTEDALEIKIYDYDAHSTNDLIGQAEVQVAGLISTYGVQNVTKEIRDPKNKTKRGKGTIVMMIEYQGERPGVPPQQPGMSMPQQAPPGYPPQHQAPPGYQQPGMPMQQPGMPMQQPGMPMQQPGIHQQAPAGYPPQNYPPQHQAPPGYQQPGMPMQQQGMPMQGGYPGQQQGMPMQGGYPGQQQGMPMQQQGMPMQGGYPGQQPGCPPGYYMSKKGKMKKLDKKAMKKMAKKGHY